MAAAGPVVAPFEPLRLTAALRPVLAAGEVELLTCAPVSLYVGDVKRHRDGSLTLTNHRLLWVDSQDAPRTTLALALRRVRSLSSKAGFIGLSSPKITVTLADEAAPPVRLSFHGHGRDLFLSQARQALQARVWERGQDAAQQQRGAAGRQGFSTALAGISGLRRAVERKQMQQVSAVASAFEDLDALMTQAQDMVRLVERYSEAVRTNAEAAKGDDEELADLLRDVGIQSPVTRASAGAAYDKQLSRQLADFLVVPLERSGGMLTLTDVYCLFNRARGTALVSPDDLVRACELLAPLGLPMRLRRFATGVVVVELAQSSDERRAEQLLALLPAPASSVSDVEVAERLRISLVLAKQLLLVAEEQLHLCRDETRHGTRFFRNFFLSRSPLGERQHPHHRNIPVK